MPFLHGCVRTLRYYDFGIRGVDCQPLGKLKSPISVSGNPRDEGDMTSALDVLRLLVAMALDREGEMNVPQGSADFGAIGKRDHPDTRRLHAVRSYKRRSAHASV